MYILNSGLLESLIGFSIAYRDSMVGMSKSPAEKVSFLGVSVSTFVLRF
jgi:hypothetical protein